MALLLEQAKINYAVFERAVKVKPLGNDPPFVLERKKNNHSLRLQLISMNSEQVRVSRSARISCPFSSS